MEGGAGAAAREKKVQRSARRQKSKKKNNKTQDSVVRRLFFLSWVALLLFVGSLLLSSCRVDTHVGEKNMKNVSLVWTAFCWNKHPRQRAHSPRCRLYKRKKKRKMKEHRERLPACLPACLPHHSPADDDLGQKLFLLRRACIDRAIEGERGRGPPFEACVCFYFPRSRPLPPPSTHTCSPQGTPGGLASGLFLSLCLKI